MKTYPIIPDLWVGIAPDRYRALQRSGRLALRRSRMLARLNMRRVPRWPTRSRKRNALCPRIMHRWECPPLRVRRILRVIGSL